MSATDERERIIADSQFGDGANGYAPATWYHGISTSIPNDDGSNFTEPTGADYGRVPVPNDATNFPPATTEGGRTTKRNGTTINYGDPSSDWGVARAHGWFDSPTATTPQFVEELDDEWTISFQNSAVEFLPDSLIWGWD